MRDRIIRSLGELPYSRLLVYLMGPYRAFDVGRLLEGAEVGEADIALETVPNSVDFGTLVDSDFDLDRRGATMDLLLFVRDRLRSDPGVNAFLAVDIDISLAEMDAATQSIEFASASNTIVYVVPNVGDNLGVGIEVGSVLESIFQDRDRSAGGSGTQNRSERVVFVHESGVSSAMIAAVCDRWEARVYSYEDRDDLVDQVRLFVRDIARREQRGDLPTLDGDT